MRAAIERSVKDLADTLEGIEVPDSDGTRVEFDYQGKQCNVEMSVQMTYSSLGKYSALLKE